MSLTINGLSVASMRWLAPWSGVWVAELDLLGGELVPTGPAVIASTDGISLVGAVDDEHSGSFGERRRVRVRGGRGGWQKAVRAQHYHSDVGVQLASVVSTTAAEVGESAIVLLPVVLGVDFLRRGGESASQIFATAGVDWWTGLDGVTRVGARPPAVPPTSLEILDWDQATATASFRASVLVEPGTVVVDARFGSGKKIVRQVEATVADGSVSGSLWLADAAPSVGDATSELVEGLAALANRATRAAFGRLHEYRVIAMAGDRVELQAVSAADGMPDVLPASVWAGISGYRATLTPSSRVLVGCIAGDPGRPYVAAYEPPEGGGWRPVKIELDAVAAVEIGEQAAAVVLGAPAGALPVVRLTPAFTTWIGAVTAYVNGLAPGTCIAPVDLASGKVIAS